tara:strand:+ start:10341 stop:10691 length:351 start_codon:yes stop_codon:yes gene_type:complete
MKTTLLLLILAFTLSLQAQELSKEIYTAFKDDTVATLQKASQYQNLNICYEAENSSYSLLSLSIKTNAENCFTQLLSEKEIDLNLACTGKTPLHYAAKYGRLEMLKKLIDAGADIS